MNVQRAAITWTNRQKKKPWTKKSVGHVIHSGPFKGDFNTPVNSSWQKFTLLLVILQDRCSNRKGFEKRADQTSKNADSIQQKVKGEQELKKKTFANIASLSNTKNNVLILVYAFRWIGIYFCKSLCHITSQLLLGLSFVVLSENQSHSKNPTYIVGN